MALKRLEQAERCAARAAKLLRQVLTVQDLRRHDLSGTNIKVRGGC